MKDATTMAQMRAVRENMRECLADLAGLRPHVDPGNLAASDFNEAWDIALADAKAAAKRYVAVMGGLL